MPTRLLCRQDFLTLRNHLYFAHAQELCVDSLPLDLPVLDIEGNTAHYHTRTDELHRFRCVQVVIVSPVVL